MSNRSEMRARLQRWGCTLREVKRLQNGDLRELEALRDVAALGARRLDGMPHGNKTGDPTARAALRMIERAGRFADALEAKNAEIDAMLTEKSRIDAVVSALPEVQQRVIRARYGDGGASWVAVSQAVNYSDAEARLIEKKAVDALIEALG